MARLGLERLKLLPIFRLRARSYPQTQSPKTEPRRRRRRRRRRARKGRLCSKITLLMVEEWAFSHIDAPLKFEGLYLVVVDG
jgi:hypothetical protein